MTISCFCTNTWNTIIIEVVFCTFLVEDTKSYPKWFVIGLIATVIGLTAAFGVVCFMLCKHFLS